MHVNALCSRSKLLRAWNCFTTHFCYKLLIWAAGTEGLCSIYLVLAVYPRGWVWMLFWIRFINHYLLSVLSFSLRFHRLLRVRKEIRKERFLTTNANNSCLLATCLQAEMGWRTESEHHYSWKGPPRTSSPTRSGKDLRSVAEQCKHSEQHPQVTPTAQQYPIPGVFVTSGFNWCAWPWKSYWKNCRESNVITWAETLQE